MTQQQWDNKSSLPRPGTFETMGAGLKHEDFDTVSVNYVTGAADEAWKAAERLAADDRVKPEVKAQEVKGALADGKQVVVTRAEEMLTSLETERAALEKKARRSLAPSETDVARLAYIRDSLRGQIAARTLNQPALYALWQQALDEGDKLTLQVFYDHGASLLAETRDPKAAHTPVDSDFHYGKLRPATDEALLNAEQKAARKALLRNEATRIRIAQALSSQSQRLDSAALHRDGKTLVDRRAADRVAEMRRGF